VRQPSSGSALGDVFGGGDGDAASIPLTQEELAQVVGTTRPTVNRLLRDGEAEGILQVSRGRVTVTDRTRLHRKAR
jgi:CRP/FNR family cyclic AMP-dependent transcriptional regulator